MINDGTIRMPINKSILIISQVYSYLIKLSVYYYINYKYFAHGLKILSFKLRDQDLFWDPDSLNQLIELPKI